MSEKYDFFAPFAADDAFASGAGELAAAYRSAEPFPHIVLDDVFRADVLRAVVDEIPSPVRDPERLFRRHDPGVTIGKFAYRNVPELGPASIALINTLNAQPFLDFLTALTGIEGLIPDPYLSGGGFHLIVAGGFLNVHADFNVHPQLHVYRRLNLLLYLNETWPAEWGGALELWRPDMSSAARAIAPLFNRTVIFGTTATSFHGHPDPLTCPPDAVRRSLALYYYTARPAEDVVPHSTLWQRRPHD